jgi:transposase
MAPDSVAKRQALEAAGTFNPRFAQVHHELFRSSAFFDPQDLLQLKYEAVRAIQVEHHPIARAAAEFGLSRPTLYQAQRHFQARGLEGLYPQKRGPKGAHKLTPAVRAQLQTWATDQPQLSAQELAQRLRQQLRVKVHPRTIEKTLHGREKKGRQRAR